MMKKEPFTYIVEKSVRGVMRIVHVVNLPDVSYLHYCDRLKPTQRYQVSNISKDPKQEDKEKVGTTSCE